MRWCGYGSVCIPHRFSKDVVKIISHHKFTRKKKREKFFFWIEEKEHQQEQGHLSVTMSSSIQQDMVKLVSKEGHEFFITKEAARLSGYLQVCLGGFLLPFLLLYLKFLVFLFLFLFSSHPFSLNVISFFFIFLLSFQKIKKK